MQNYNSSKKNVRNATTNTTTTAGNFHRQRRKRTKDVVTKTAAPVALILSSVSEASAKMKLFLSIAFCIPVYLLLLDQVQDQLYRVGSKGITSYFDSPFVVKKIIANTNSNNTITVSSSSSSWVDLHTMHTGNELYHRSLIITRVNHSDADDDVNSTRNRTKTQCTIDILSIGSRTLPLLQQAQYTTWASHPSRRFFVVANELDDPDPDCSVNVTAANQYAYSLAHQCGGNMGKRFWQSHNSTSSITDAWTNHFARQQWLEGKANPGGWMCAQRRFPAALSKLLRLYREAAAVVVAEAEEDRVVSAEIFPDYLIFVDDDTAVNIEYISKALCLQPKERDEEQRQHKKVSTQQKNDNVKQLLEPQLPHVPTVYAGCLVRMPPVQTIKFSFPYGGFGTFFSRGALERFATPLQCNFEEYSKDSMIRRSDPWLLSSFAKEVCRQLLPSAKVHVGERTLFTRGMSVSDLMGAYIASKQHSSCLHSDWAVGYFVNFYNISRHTPIGDGDWYHEFDTQTPHGRIFDLDGSLIYKKVLNYCRNNGAEECRKHPTRAICHQLNPKDMNEMFQY